MNVHRLFVYGKLRKGGGLAITERYPMAEFISDAKVKGRLFDLGDYPALMIGDTGAVVKGEIYRVDDQMLSEMDEIEASADYRRMTELVIADDEEVSCWIYLPDPAVCSGREVISSGDWIEHCRDR